MKEPDFIDYSVIYRNKEVKQLQKRLKKVRISLYINALLPILGAAAFSVLYPDFSGTHWILYLAVSFLYFLLSAYSQKKPHKSILWGILVLIGFWTLDTLISSEEWLFSINILKLFMLASLVIHLQTAKQAEIIKKDLHLS